MPDPVFQSTAFLSPGNQIYLERKRIDRLLEKAIQNSLVVVTGAGYGETYAGVAPANPKAASRMAKIDFPETERQFERYMVIPLEEIDPAPGMPYIPQAMRKNIFMLIKSEVMDAVSEGLQRFLIKLSLIEHLVPELLEDLAGDQSLIREMNGIDSFVRFETYHNEYHIHHLVLDYPKTRQDGIPEDEKKALEAVCRHRNRDKSGAFASLEQAYRLAVPNGLGMPFIEPGKDMRSLADAVLKDGSNIPREWLEKIRLAVPNGLGMPFIEPGKDMRSLTDAVRITAKMDLV